MSHLKIGLALALPLTSLWLSGCSVVNSTDVKTSSISANITATAKGNGKTTIDASFYVGSGFNGTKIEIKSPDKLVAYAGGDSKSMKKKSDVLNNVSYQATFNNDSVNTTFRVAFNRRNDTSAPTSTVQLPDPFTASLSSSSVKYGDEVTVKWDPASNGKMSIEAESDCGGTQYSYSETTKDDGSTQFNANKLISSDKDFSSCTVKISLARSKKGSLDSNYGKGGSIYAKQVRNLSFKLTK
jgi:hypothetical protein